MEGNSIAAHLYGYVPYLYSSTPSNFKESDLHKYREALNRSVRADIKAKDVPEDVVLDIKVVLKENIYGFQGNKQSRFLCIYVLLPKYISATKRVLESGFDCPGYGLQGYHTFESNIDFEIRFMSDFNIFGCNWIEIPAGKYQVRDNKEMTSRCQLEVNVLCKDIISYPVEGEWLKIAPLRILSFDIECAGRKGIFPEAEKDPG
jgi:DNA polymerase delta subunit 1